MFCCFSCFKYHDDLTPQNLSFDLEEMLKKAKDYSRADTYLFEYIQNILRDSTFQSNPKGYLVYWKEERGNIEIRKHPEDTARDFFDENFKF